MTELTGDDRAIVALLVQKALDAGPDAVVRAVRIHERNLADLTVRRRQLADETRANERAIAMREWALIHLHAHPEGTT